MNADGVSVYSYISHQNEDIVDSTEEGYLFKEWVTALAVLYFVIAKTYSL